MVVLNSLVPGQQLSRGLVSTTRHHLTCTVWETLSTWPEIEIREGIYHIKMSMWWSPFTGLSIPWSVEGPCFSFFGVSFPQNVLKSGMKFCYMNTIKSLDKRSQNNDLRCYKHCFKRIQKKKRRPGKFQLFMSFAFSISTFVFRMMNTQYRHILKSPSINHFRWWFRSGGYVNVHDYCSLRPVNMAKAILVMQTESFLFN